MIFQVLVKRRRYWLTLVAVVLSIFCSFPTSASLPSLPENFSANWGQKTWVVAEGAVNSTASIQGSQTDHLFQQLNLTGQQQQRISQIHRQYRERISRKKNAITRLQQQLSDLMVGDAPVELLRAKNQKLSRIRQEMGVIRFETMLATREILTLEQRQKFRELVQFKVID